MIMYKTTISYVMFICPSKRHVGMEVEYLSQQRTCLADKGQEFGPLNPCENKQMNKKPDMILGVEIPALVRKRQDSLGLLAARIA